MALWIEIISILLSIGLAIACLRRGRWRPAYRYLVLLCFAAGLYEVAQIGYQSSVTPDHKLFWVRVGFVAAFLMLPVALMLPAAVVERMDPHPAVKVLSWGGFLMLGPLAFSDHMFYNDPATGLVGRFGPAFALSLPLFVLGVAHFVGTFVRELNRNPDEAVCNRVAWVLLGACGFLLAVAPDMLRRTGLLDLFGRPVAAFGVMFFMSCTTYAVLRHRLMDIEVAISRGIVYTALFPLLAGIYVAIGETLEQLTQKLVQSDSWTGSIVAALGVAMLFEPARRTLERRVDYYFIRDDDMVESLRRLEKVAALVVAEDVDGLKRLGGELATVIEKVEGRREPAPVRLERAGRG
jgi:hypothetical protein